MRRSLTAVAIAGGSLAVLGGGSSHAACIASLKYGDRLYLHAGPLRKPVALQERLHGVKRPGCNDYVVVTPDGQVTPANEPDVPVPAYKITRVPSVLAVAMNTTEVYVARGFFTDLKGHPLRKFVHGTQVRRIGGPRCRTGGNASAVVVRPPGPAPRVWLRARGSEADWEHDPLLRIAGFRLRGGQPYVREGDRVRIGWITCPGHPRVLRTLTLIASRTPI